MKIRTIPAIWYKPGNSFSGRFYITGFAMHTIFSMNSKLFLTGFAGVQLIYLRRTKKLLRGTILFNVNGIKFLLVVNLKMYNLLLIMEYS